MSLTYCERGGYLVSGTSEVRVDPSEYQAESHRPPLACNQVKCGACQAMVRSEPGFFPLALDEPRDWAAIYETDDWATLPAMDRDPEYRLYVCRCRSAPVAARYSLIRPDGEIVSPWRCAGHPATTFPLTIEGVTVTRFSDLHRVISENIEKPLSLQAFYERLRGTSLSSSIPKLAVRLLSDPRPHAKMKALGFFFSHPDAPGSARVTELARGDRSGFVGVADPNPITHDQTLESRILLTFARMWEAGIVDDHDALDVFHRDVLRPSTSATAIETLAERDSRWLVEHADEIATAAPNAIGQLIASVYGIARDSTDLVALAERAQGLSPEQRAATRKIITVHISSTEPMREKLLAVFADP